LPEYEVSIKFHIFPYKKIVINAKTKEEAKAIANKEAQQLKHDLKHSIDKVKIKSHNIDEFF
jgi:predicted AlkP superfamily phosphohydrolase/phosphomutase